MKKYLFSKTNVIFYLRTATLRRALRARGFVIISSCDGVIGFFVMISSAHFVISCPVIWSISPWLLFRKKFFTIRSSPEWKEMIEIFPHGRSKSVASERSFSRDQNSSLTAILRAWNTLGRASREMLVIILVSSFVVERGCIFRASRIFLVINPAFGSSPYTRNISAILS